MILKRRIIVCGRVQGVSYRAFVHDKAHKLGVSGWVKNLPDGSVEVCFRGCETDFLQFVEHLKTGSRFSRVDDLTVSDDCSSEDPDGFTVRY